MMRIAQVVETTNDKQAGSKCLRLSGQGTSATGQPAQAQAEGGIEAFNVSGIDDTSRLLSYPMQAVNLARATLNDAALNFQTGR
ncbi:MAG: hypothetical protein ACK2U5_15285 [Candidatus Promineifilaceae bacterium]|jgi:hypothetical protein